MVSNLPTKVGFCHSDIAEVADIVNQAQQRLVFDRGAGDTGWWGSWARMVFNVLQSNPFITLPREVARLINVDVCQHPIAIQNEFYEFLEFGPGLQPHRSACTSVSGNNCQFLQMYDRGVVTTFGDLAPGKSIRVFLTDPADSGARTLIQGVDMTGATITSQDGLIPTLGEFVTLGTPFADFPMPLEKLTGIQKDTTIGPVKYYSLDVTTGATELILTMEPSEQVASYRRMFINGLPTNCCSTGPTTQVTGMAKLELIPVKVETDYLLIQNLEALTEECKAIRWGDMDSASAAQKSADAHRKAIGYLKGELGHYEGITKPALIFKPFGSATLRRSGIGLLT